MKHSEAQTTHPIAIVGMGCLFPKAQNLKEYWRLLCQGEDAITDIPETHWAAQDYFDTDPKRPDHTYAKRGGFLPTTSFDPTEWGIPPMALEATDTAQLLGLVAAKMALEDAGYGDDREFDRDRVSVILGVTGTLELVIPLGARLGHPIWRRALLDAGIDPQKAEEVVERIGDGYVDWQENSFPGLLGNVVAGRIANRLDFGGTNCVVDAACASSLSAVHLAMMELSSGKADMVLSGGIDTLNDIFMYMCFSKTPALSPSGDVRPFSEQADGTMISEGLGILVLKRLADAERDGDKIYAVIRGMGSSSDGKSQSIYAPRAAGQVKALRRAYTQADVQPRDIGMVEAHGTGTKVGDATEFEALREVYREDNDEKQWCALGTVKSQIGHTKAAAGSASLIKAALALHHKTLPPSIKIQAPNPKMELEQSPFYLNTQTRPWLTQQPRRAGVSALGFGGSNFHAVLEEYTPNKDHIAWDQSVEIIAFSGDTAASISEQVKQWQDWLAEAPSSIAIARRTAESRQEFATTAPYRLVLVAPYQQSLSLLLEQAAQRLQTSPDQAVQTSGIYYSGAASQDVGKVAFLFPGQGSQYVDMASDWVRTFPACWQALQNAEQVLGQDISLSEKLFPPPTFSKETSAHYHQALAHTAVAQPALGAVSAGISHVLQGFGLQPDATAGHSYGELVALYAAGCMTQEELFSLSQERGRLMAQGDDDRGTMLAVRAPLQEIDQLLESAGLDVVLANRNSPKQGVLSGSREAIAQAEAACREKGYTTRRLDVSAAFHSSLVGDAQAPFRDFLAGITFQPASIPVYANTTGQPYPTDSASIGTMLAEQLLSPVRFVEQIEAMYQNGVRVFIEVGPKTVLTSLVRSILSGKQHHAIGLDRSKGKPSGLLDLAQLLARVAALGLPVRLDAWEEAPPEPRKQRMQIPLSGANYRAPVKPRGPLPALAEERSASSTLPICPANREGFLHSNTEDFSTPPSPAAGGEGELPLGIRYSSGGGVWKPTDPSHVPNQNTQPVNVPESKTQNPEPIGIQPMPNRVQQITMANTKPTSPEHTPTHAPTNGVSHPPPSQQPIMAQSSPQNTWAGSAPAGQPALWTEALQLIRQGLHAMQTLQHQTTLAHQRFLEGQEQSSLALHEMMLRSQQFVAAAMHMPVPDTTRPSPQPAAHTRPALPPQMPAPALPPQAWSSGNGATTMSQPPAQAPAPSFAPAFAQGHSAPVLQSAPQIAQSPAPMPDMALKPQSSAVGVMAQQKPAPGVALNAQRSAVDLSVFQRPQLTPAPVTTAPAPVTSVKTDLTQVMLEVVAELTGYPTEMLDPAMDMEADLGIDSIKRVEILSTVSERVPEAAEVDPEQMGRMRTLQEVIDYLQQEAPTPIASASVAPAPALHTSTPETKASSQSVTDVLLQVVADLTGYPSEMLSLDMDLEADLGIDSIKRVEILSSVTEQFPALNDVDTEELRNLRTLGEIAQASKVAIQSSNGATSHPFELASLQDTLLAGRPDDIARCLLQVIALPEHQRTPLSLPEHGEIWVVGQDHEMTQALRAAFQYRGYPTSLLLPGQDVPAIHGLAGVVIVAEPASPSAVWSATEEDALKRAFVTTRAALSHLQDTAKAGYQPFFATVTRMDGAFGLAQMRDVAPLQGGLAGLPKTIQHEAPTIASKAIDLPHTWEAWAPVAEAVVTECLHTGSIEVGLHPDHRCTLQLQESAPEPGKFVLESGDVFVISGGARGVTAAVAHTIAQALRPTLVLLGRSPLPPEEPAWLAALDQEGSIKKALFQHGWEGQSIRNPKELQGIYQRICQNREIRENLQKLRETGATVEYHAVDVRDASALSTLFAQIRRDLGPIRGVMHAAGVLEDRFIIDKTTDQFNKVFDTKVQGLRALLQATAQDDLHALVLFSSVSGRAGNKGQVDYAMANEVLNKVAQQQAALRPQCRVLSANWGPWDGGMVTPELKRHFAAQGIQLISLEAGARALLRELQTTNSGAVEVVFGEVFEGEAPQTSTESAKQQTSPGSLFERVLSLDTHKILEAHQLQGKPVVPLALLMDWLGQAIQQAYPQQTLWGYDNVRVLNGVILPPNPYRVWLEAAPPQHHDGQTTIALTLYGESASGPAKPHLKATAILGHGSALQPPQAWEAIEPTRAYPVSVAQAYQEILFHGEALHGLSEIQGYSEQSILALSNTAPAPTAWMTSPFQAKWVHDPLVLDDAFQLAILWCFATQDKVSLPTSLATYRQYKAAFTGPIQIALQVEKVTAHQITGNFRFHDNQGDIVADITGYTCTMDASLLQAFHPTSHPTR